MEGRRKRRKKSDDGKERKRKGLVGGRMKKEIESFERNMKVRTERKEKKERGRKRTNLRTCQTQHRHKSCFFVQLELF